MRRLITLLAAVLAVTATARGVAAQQVSGVPRVGVLLENSPEQGRRAANEFREGMRSLGWIERSTISIEDRFASGDPALLSANAAEFAAAKVDVIVAISTARAARQATSTIPIVMTTGDAVGSGLAASLARPGGNLTGFSVMWPDVVAKQLEMLKEAVPRVSRSASCCSKTVRVTRS
jgi:putative tryptophan/tyrosine transport system substrate-binding protein